MVNPDGLVALMVMTSSDLAGKSWQPETAARCYGLPLMMMILSLLGSPHAPMLSAIMGE